MGYLPRFDAAGTVHHVWTSGAGPCAIYADDEDRLAFVATSAREFARRGVVCLAYCLMTTHYHFVLRMMEPTLSEVMQRINGLYARSFNARHERRGHLFGARFGSTFVQTQEHLLVALRYVFLNPLDIVGCDHPLDWPWSSYRTAARGVSDQLADTDALLRLVGGSDRLRAFVEGDLFTWSEEMTFTSSGNDVPGAEDAAEDEEAA